MKNKQTSRSKHIDFIILDILILELSYLLAYYMRIGHLLENGFYITEEYRQMNVIVILAHIAIVFFTENYSGIIRRGYLKEFQAVIVYNAELMGVLLVFLFFTKQSEVYSRIVVGTFIALNTAFIYTERATRKHYLRQINQNTDRRSRLLIISDEENAYQTTMDLKSYNYSGFIVMGIVVINKRMEGANVGDIPVVANRENMYEYVKSNIIDEVFLEYNGQDLESIVNNFLAMGVAVHVHLNKFLSDMPNVSLDKLNNYTVISSSISMMSFKQKTIKRFMDIVVSLVGILCTCILMIIFGPIIRIQSHGSVIFKQNRVGKNGRIFKLYKFRSMYADAEERKKELMDQNEMTGLMFKVEDDPRITPIGRFMRKTSLDEFPQFFNILKGDMSLVGTRPPTEDEYELYEQHHKSRLAMKPGLTGLWQVSGRNEITDFEEVVRLDNEYIRNFSINYDIKILAKTFVVVMARKGAV